MLSAVSPCLSHSDYKGQQQLGLIMDASMDHADIPKASLLFSSLTTGYISCDVALAQNYVYPRINSNCRYSVLNAC